MRSQTQYFLNVDSQARGCSRRIAVLGDQTLAELDELITGSRAQENNRRNVRFTCDKGERNVSLNIRINDLCLVAGQRFEYSFDPDVRFGITVEGVDH